MRSLVRHAPRAPGRYAERFPYLREPRAAMYCYFPGGQPLCAE
jgi:hypothetical protein